VTRILLRAPKDPFEVVDAEQVLMRNLIGNNSGNLVFIDAAHKLLSVPGAEIVADRFDMTSRDARRINERFDVYAIPLANAFRPSFAPVLDRMTDVIRSLRIPVVVLGVGAQATLDYDWTKLHAIEPSVRAFVGAVLDHGPSIGVRGEMTADYLRSLGFRDVEVVGCPSMFMWGADLTVTRKVPELTPDSRIALTVSPYVRPVGPIVKRHAEAYPNLIYIAQDIDSLELLLWGATHPDAYKQLDNPAHLGHPLVRDDRTRLFLDPWPWIEELRHQDFSFGTRIHGTITALLAGTPGVVIAHDSRTLELARYFGIPHRTLREVDDSTDAADLYAAADFTSVVGGHAARWAVFRDYMTSHGLDNVFAHEGAAAAWDERVAETPWPPAVRRDPAVRAPKGIGARVRRARFVARRAARRSQIKHRPQQLISRLRGGTPSPTQR
jgi:hypothetical protein